MGRGRAKAKQAKVARDLKYRTFEPDFNELQRELHDQQTPGTVTETDEFDYADEYAEYGEHPEHGEHAEHTEDPEHDDLGASRH